MQTSKFPLSFPLYTLPILMERDVRDFVLGIQVLAEAHSSVNPTIPLAIIHSMRNIPTPC